MMLSRMAVMCTGPRLVAARSLVSSGGGSSSALKNAALQMRQPANLIARRSFQRDSLTRAERIAERQTLRERAMAPVGPNGE